MYVINHSPVWMNILTNMPVRQAEQTAKKTSAAAATGTTMLTRADKVGEVGTFLCLFHS